MTTQERRQRYREKLAQDVGRTLNQLLEDAKKRIDKKNLCCDVTVDDLVELWCQQQGRCAKSRLPMSLTAGTHKDRNYYKVSIDRRDSSQGYVKNNIQLVCYYYNTAKGAGTDQAVIDFFRHVIANEDNQNLQNLY